MTGAESTDGLILFSWDVNLEVCYCFQFFLSELTGPRYNPLSGFPDNSLPPEKKVYRFSERFQNEVAVSIRFYVWRVCEKQALLL